MTRAARASACALALGLAGATAPLAAAPQATLSLSVRPSFVVVPNGGSAALVVVNTGGAAARLTTGVAAYSVGATGRVVLSPARESPRSARDWVRAEPATLTLAPGEVGHVRLSARRRSAATPGDHHAFVLLTSSARRPAPGQVAVRTRIGVSVMVRVAGGLRRDLIVHAVTLRRRGPLRVLTLGVSNRGNVVERLLGGQVTAELRRGGRLVATIRARPRALLAGTSGVIGLPYRGPALGAVRATVRLIPMPARLAGPGIASAPAPIVRSVAVTM